MIAATQIRKGMTIIYEKEIHMVLDHRHYTPGNKRGFVQATLRNLKSGKATQTRFASEDRVELAVLDSRPCQYLYHDADGYHFMDLQDYQNFPLGEEAVGEGRHYFKENMEIGILFYEGKPVELQLPKTVVLKVVESPPWVKGDSVTNAMKPAVCENGLKIQVPIFIQEGTDIIVNTERVEYVSRA